MECDLCTEQFDGAERVPKVLPCGHTACLQCLRRLPDCSCPTCRRDFNGPPEGLPTNFTVLKFLEGRRLDSTPIVWCSDCRTAATSLCMDHVHDVLPIRTALRHHLQYALPLAAEQLLTFQDQCLDDQVLSALLLLMVESWEVSLRGGGHELTGTLRNNTEDPCMKVLCPDENESVCLRFQNLLLTIWTGIENPLKTSENLINWLCNGKNATLTGI